MWALDSSRAHTNCTTTWVRTGNAGPRDEPRSVTALTGRAPMGRIRLRRVGRKKNPVYRIVVADSQSPRDGKFIEIIGQYAPREAQGGLKVQTERANYW